MFELNLTQNYILPNSNEEMTITIVNARKFIMSFNGKFKTIKSDGKIIELDNYSEKIQIGQTLKFIIKNKVYYYKVGLIEELKTNSLNSNLFSISSSKQTNTTNFILPLIAEKDWMLNNLINSYSFLEFDDLFEKDQLHSIYLYYRYDGTKKFYDFEEFILKDSNFNQMINIDDFNILISMNIPEKFIEDYYYILDSKYSMISNEAKLRIINFFDLNENSIMYNVLYKTERRRKNLESLYNVQIEKDAELWDVIDEYAETFGMKDLIEIDKTI